MVERQFEENLAELITVTSKEDSEKDINKSWGEKKKKKLKKKEVKKTYVP